MLRRSVGTLERLSFGSDLPPTMRLPAVGSISFRSSLMNVDLPEPEGPTRNTNSPLSICTDTSSRPMIDGSYVLVIPSKRIIASAAGAGSPMPRPRAPGTGSRVGVGTATTACWSSVSSLMGGLGRADRRFPGFQGNDRLGQAQTTSARASCPTSPRAWTRTRGGLTDSGGAYGCEPSPPGVLGRATTVTWGQSP